MNAYCHVSRQIADHADEEGRRADREDYIEACLVELDDTGSVDVGEETITIENVINEIGDDPSHEQAYMEIMQGNTKFLQSIMERIARGFVEEELGK